MGKLPGKISLKFLIPAMLFPLFLAFGYPASFLASFSGPSPHHMEIAVVADSSDPDSAAKAQEIVQGLKIQAGDAVTATTVDSADEAKAQVENLDVRAAYDPATGNAYVATAGSVAGTSMGAEPVIQQIAEQAETGYNVVDLKAPEPKDSTGGSFMYLIYGAMIGGFVTATMIFNMAPNIRWWKKLAVLGAMAAVAAVAGTTIMWGFYGIYSGHIVEAALIAALTFLAVGVFQLGLNSVIGMLGLIPGMLLFIIFGIPASGIAVPTDMLPGFYQMLHKMLPTGASGDLMRSVLYFDGNNIGTPVMTLLLWIVMGLGMLWINSLRSSEPDEIDAEHDGHPKVRRRDPDDPLLVAYEDDAETDDATDAVSTDEPVTTTTTVTGGATHE